MQTIYFMKVHHAGNQYRHVLTQYHWVPTSTALYWPSIQWFDGLDHVNQIFSESISHWQPVPPCSDPVSPSTNRYRSIMTQCHQVTTNTALYWPVYRLADLWPSTWHHMNAHQGSSLTRATCHFCSANCHSEWLSSTKPDKRQIYARIYALKRECERQDVVYSGAWVAQPVQRWPLPRFIKAW